MDPRGMIGRIYKEHHYTAVHCYTQKMKALGLVVSEKKNFYVFPMRHPGRGLYGPQGHDRQDF